MVDTVELYGRRCLFQRIYDENDENVMQWMGPGTRQVNRSLVGELAALCISVSCVHAVACRRV